MVVGRWSLGPERDIPAPDVYTTPQIMGWMMDEYSKRYYVDKLGFVKRQDQTMGAFRWLTVSPPEQKDLEVVLERPTGEMGEARRKQLAMQIGQAPAWVFETPDCKAAYETLKSRGVEFVTPPQALPYGVQAVFKDLYGNTFALVQRE